jgi:hypothetical protein
MSKPPGLWPEQFLYITESFSAHLHPMILKNLLCAVGVDEESIIPLLDKATIHPHITLKPLSSPHPLAGQWGLFASDFIDVDSDLGEYVGELHLIDACWPLNPVDYDFAWTLKMENFFFIIDAKKWANQLAFVNDFRGLSKQPNVAPKWVVHRGSYHLIFRTVAPIEKGEELLIDYGADYWRAPHRQRMALRAVDNSE